MILWAGAASFVVSFLVVGALSSRFANLILDRPNERSLHRQPVPRTGGIGLLAGVLAGASFGDPELWTVLAVALALAMLSLADDVRGLPVRLRLSGHVLAACAVVWYLTAPMDAMPFVLLVLAVAWITNLYNFMDGADGLAGGMAAIGFATYAAAAYAANHSALQLAAVVIAVSALAFLVYNFHPARIFLGDMGSIPLGFLAAVIGLWGWRDDVWPLWFPVLVFGPFIADATVTLAKRAVRGEKVWQAHREHYYQRLVRMGFGHRAAAFIFYAAMLLCGICAMLGRAQPPIGQAAAFLAAGAVLAALAVWVDVRWARGNGREPR